MYFYDKIKKIGNFYKSLAEMQGFLCIFPKSMAFLCKITKKNRGFAWIFIYFSKLTNTFSKIAQIFFIFLCNLPIDKLNLM